jgi:hypothetical protein
MTSFLGFILAPIVIYILGAVTGSKLWTWIKEQKWMSWLK